MLSKFLKHRLQWTGHIARMDDSRIPEKVFGGCCGVRRSVGRPKGRWEDVFWWDAVDLL